MIFQTLDDKQQCVGIYCDGSILYDSLPDELSGTWRYTQYLNNKNIEYANLYCAGKRPQDVCPDNIKEPFNKLTNKLKAYLRSFQLGKISLNDHCFYDLVPESFLLEYFELKNQITEHVLSTYEKPPNYDFLLDLTKVVTEINYRKLNIDLNSGSHTIISKKGKEAFSKYKKYQPYCKYDIFGTKTGRLTNTPGTFPILTMDKDFRKIVKPTNDWFVELDYNGAELRTFLALSDKKQPKGDIHAWNAKHIFNNCSRDDAKSRIFAWLYNPQAHYLEAEKVYNRIMVKQRYWDGEHVKTPYGRSIAATEHYALSYTIQSTLSDTVLRQMIKIHKMLENRKSHIAFCVHDSIVLDMTDDEKHLIPEIKEIFAANDLDTFEVSVKGGKNFGSLHKLRL